MVSSAWKTLWGQPLSSTHKPFSLRTKSSSLSIALYIYFVFSGLFLNDMQLLCSTSPGCLYRSEFISFTGWFWSNVSTGLSRKIWVLASPEFQVAGAVSSELNLTCLQQLPNGPYTNHNSLRDRSFQSVWTQKQNKSRCILGAFIAPMLEKIKLWRISLKIPGNVPADSGECSERFWELFKQIPVILNFEFLKSCLFFIKFCC